MASKKPTTADRVVEAAIEWYEARLARLSLSAGLHACCAANNALHLAVGAHLAALAKKTKEARRGK